MPKAIPSGQHALLDLAALDELLRRHDMPRGPDAWQTVHDLLALRFQQGRIPGPDKPEELARLIGPLLCRGPEEQARFPHIVAQWLSGTDTLSTSGQFSTFDSTPWQRWQNRLRRFDRRQSIGLLALLLLLAGLWATLALNPPADPIVAPPPLPTIATQPATVPAGQPPAVKVDDWAPPNRLPEPVRLPPAWEQARGRVGLALRLLPCLLALLWLYRCYLGRPKILETDTPDGDEVARDLDFANPAQPLYGGGQSEQALNSLGRVSYGESRRLHIAKTVQATARQAGYFVPCHRLCLERPVYLILVHSQHIHDQQALLGEELVRRFREARLTTESYRFLDSPSQLIPWPLAEGGPLSLGELALRHDCARLIIISEGRILFHPATGQPRLWLDDFAAWPQRVWLGAGEVDALDARLLLLKGFLYLPLASLSLADLAVYLSADEAWPVSALRESEAQDPLPDSIADYPQRWLKPSPPSDIPLATLARELRAYLHEDGWALLQTLVAFPECQWKLTQAVDYLCFEGQQAGLAEAREARLTRLLKLPWFTHAYFPRYMRIHLLRQAGDAERLHIRDTWEALFSRQTGQGGITVLEPLRKLVKDLLRTDRAGALGDPIFVQILRGKRLDFWQFRLPQILAGIFLQGRNRWDLRPAVWAVVFAGLASWGGGGWWETQGKDWLVRQWQTQLAHENGRWLVSIDYLGQTQALALALQASLVPQGFRVAALRPVTSAQADSISYPPAAEAAAQRLAKTLRHVGYGVDARLLPMPESTGLRVSLAHSYQARAAFNDLLWNKQAAQPQTFQDPLQYGGLGPVMVSIPTGQFSMGSPTTENGRYPDEGPQHSVTIPRAFAIGRDEVTFDDYDRYAQASGKKLPADNGWGRGTRPVINVSWQDAQDYAAWLSRQTGQTYRLPSEAEWEYAARAGTTTAYWWGDALGKNHANGGGGGSVWDGKQTAPVGSFAANPWGLHDTAGNVWEWVADCWHDSYQGAPTDGSAWGGAANCDRGVRGGSWINFPQILRSAFRNWYRPDDSNYDQGFRLARAL